MAREEGISELLTKLLKRKVGININGDLPDNKIVEVALRVEKLGVAIWIGELELFKDPFYVAQIIAEHISNVPICFGTITLRRDCSTILNNLKSLINSYPHLDFLVGISPGKVENPRLVLERTLKCIELVKKLDIPVLCGCSSPIITRKSSKIADGILFNYVYRDFLNWIFKFMERDVFKVAYGPSLILPSRYEQDLILASAIVACSSRKFIQKFGFIEMCNLNLNFEKMIALRQRGGDLNTDNDFRKILRYKDILLEKFSISGSLEEVKERINDLLEICDYVILGDPYFRDDRCVDLLRNII